MQRIAYLIAISLVFSLMPVVHCAERPLGYIYASADASSHLAIVIDAVRRWVDVQDKSSARPGSEDGSLGGYYKDCGNKDFYCATGGLEIVIPKAMPMKHWKYHDLSCMSTAQPVGDSYRITCSSSKFPGKPSYTYSLSRGVVSIESAPVASGERFELRDESGLFAPQLSP